MSKTKLKWDRRFLELARLVATWSKDPSTKVGAVIVNPERVPIGLGYNGFPRGVDDLPARYADRPTKYGLIVHSEANAILNASARVQGCTLYTTKFPCSSCTKLIVQSGIDRVVYPPIDKADPGYQRWAEDAKYSFTMLNEAAILLAELSDDIDS